jgi:ABC-type hemin transport system ATPase subunit
MQSIHQRILPLASTAQSSRHRIETQRIRDTFSQIAVFFQDDMTSKVDSYHKQHFIETAPDWAELISRDIILILNDRNFSPTILAKLNCS